jgi:hypothetical protein
LFAVKRYVSRKEKEISGRETLVEEPVYLRTDCIFTLSFSSAVSKE